MKLEYYSNVSEEGKLQPSVSKRIKNELAAFKGQKVEITIEKFKTTRTIQQNRYLHLIIGMMAKELGYDAEELKEIIKFKFLKEEVVDENSGEVYPYIKSTAKLTKDEFSDLVDSIKHWSSDEFGIILPDPTFDY